MGSQMTTQVKVAQVSAYLTVKLCIQIGGVKFDNFPFSFETEQRGFRIFVCVCVMHNLLQTKLMQNIT